MARRTKRQIIIRVRQLNPKQWYVTIAEVESAALPALSKALPSVKLKRRAVVLAKALATQYRFDGCNVVLDTNAYRVDRRRAERSSLGR